MTANKRAVHSVVQLFIWFRGFVHSISCSLVFDGGRSVDRLIVNSVIRLSIRSLGFSFARVSVCSFVCASGLFSCSSVFPVLLAIHGHKHVLILMAVMLQRYTSSFSTDLTQMKMKVTAMVAVRMK